MRKVNGFKALHKRLKKKIVVSGKSMSTLYNYMRCIAHVSLKYNCLPTKLDIEKIEDYLLLLKEKGKTRSNFKRTALKKRRRSSAVDGSFPTLLIP